MTFISNFSSKITGTDFIFIEKLNSEVNGNVSKIRNFIIDYLW